MKRLFIYWFAVVSIFVSCSEAPSTDVLLPGNTPGGTNYYPQAARGCGDSPSFHLRWPLPSNEIEYILVGDVHEHRGMEILADSARSSLILYGSDGAVLWRKMYPDHPINFDLVSMDHEKKQIIAAHDSRLCGVAQCDTNRLDLLLWNLTADEPADFGGYDAYGAALRSEKILICLDVYLINGEGDTIASLPDFNDGLTKYRLRYGCDIDNDGQMEYLVYASKGFSASDRLSQIIKRGVFQGVEKTYMPVISDDFLGAKRRIGSYCMQSDSLEWVRDVPIYPTYMAITDFHGDDEKELLVAGYSPHNEVTLANGTDKGMGYVYAFTASGTLLWEYPIAGHYVLSLSCVADVAGSKEKEILVACSSFLGDWGHVAVLNASDGQAIWRRNTDFSYLGMTACDNDGDGKCEWYTGSNKGVVFKYSFLRKNEPRIDSVVVARTDSMYSNPIVFVAASNDIDGDGSIEIICIVNRSDYVDYRPMDTIIRYEEPELVVLSNDLVEESRFRFSRDFWRGVGIGNNARPTCRIIDLEEDGINEIALDCVGQYYLFFSYY
jgi:hypothetical protein